MGEGEESVAEETRLAWPGRGGGGRGWGDVGVGMGGEGRGWGDVGVGMGGLETEIPPLTETVPSHCRYSWCLLQHVPVGREVVRCVKKVGSEVENVKGEAEIEMEAVNGEEKMKNKESGNWGLGKVPC